MATPPKTRTSMNSTTGSDHFRPQQSARIVWWRTFALYYYAMVAFSVPAFSAGSTDSPADYVDPMIGTGGHGHTYPGAAVPFGFVQVSPDTPNKSWDGTSGYHYSDTALLGFSFNHLTGTGCPDLGNVLLRPVVGELALPAGEWPATRFSHEQEEARAGYYRVFLPEYRVNVELTATTRVGYQRYTFPSATAAHVVLDLLHGVGSVTLDAALVIEDDRTVSGYRREVGTSCLRRLGDEQYYFVAEFSRPFATAGLRVDGKHIEGKTVAGRDLKAHFDYQTEAGEQLVVRVALSTVSVENARKNLRAEARTWDFDAVAAEAKARWNQILGNVRIATPDSNLKKTFYTAMYHAHLCPIVFNDVDGRFRGPDGRVHRAEGFDYYTVLSIWDTFRAQQPLLTILQPHRVNDIVKTMLLHYKVYGKNMLPVLVYGGKEGCIMIGNHSLPVIAEAYTKGLRNWDANEALAAMIASTERSDADGIDSYFVGYEAYRRQGWIPSRPQAKGGRSPQTVSRVLEYAYDDACLARFARCVGREDVAERYTQRASNWRNVFDSATGFMRGRNEDGSWVTPFDPTRLDFAYYTEANAWQYSFFVPHDVAGLIKATGGDEAFVGRLDDLFDPSRKLPNALNDVSGLVGMYAHGNEPCHNYAFLYHFAGQPWRSQARVRQIASTLYTTAVDGICGNEDCGQMSAWFVFAAMGFFPFDPATGNYLIGSPLVERATIQLDTKLYEGRTFTVEATNNSPDNIYIQSATLNGKILNRSWIRHREITDGGTLHLVMGPNPNTAWGATKPLP